jgi:hypothetical protein
MRTHYQFRSEALKYNVMLLVKYDIPEASTFCFFAAAQVLRYSKKQIRCKRIYMDPRHQHWYCLPKINKNKPNILQNYFGAYFVVLRLLADL